MKRIVFHEITESAIREAVKDAHDVNETLVRAQESRRILDRLWLHAVAGALEEGADRPECRPRATLLSG